MDPRGPLLAQAAGMPGSDRDAETSEMFAYYDARAGGYDDFYHGKGAAIGPLSSEYPIDAGAIAAMLSSFGHGDVLDLACGTGFWLSAYGCNARSITLVDQSAPALARCAQRINALALQGVACVVRGDIFHVPLVDSGFDACVLGFILSHLADPRSKIKPKWKFLRRPTCARPQAVTDASTWLAQIGVVREGAATTSDGGRSDADQHPTG